MNNNIGFNNKAWGRSNPSPNLLNQGSIQPQLMNQSGLGNMGTGMVQFPSNQQTVFQNMGLQQQNLGIGLQQMANNAMNAAATLSSQIASNPIFQQVTYPNTRGLNPTAFQTNLPMSNNQNNSGSGKQRVFTGKVTQMHDNFGLVDEEVMFQMNVCVKGSHPIVGDRVLVEAQYTPNMPFKWNATRIQVLSGNQSRQSKNYGNNYSAVPPPDRGGRKGGRRERSRERDRDDDEIDRKRRREERMREREKEEKKSPISKRTKSRSRSPKGNRRRTRIIPRYMVQVPKIDLDLEGGDVLEVKRRYKNMYIPSDFFYTCIKWVESFPASKPFSLSKPCSFHVMNKEVESVFESASTIIEPTDSDYLFSAKVMLMSTPGLEEIYQKCCALAEDKDAEEKDYIHPTRLINFLVGLRGKNETMAIGGAWSPSLDGENPDKDPSVLIRTAIRTCKSLTGIDLSNCTQWYRFLELYYRRSESTHKGKIIPARVETVVLFLPDVWSCLPTRLEWDGLHAAYRKQLERILNQSEAAETGDDMSSPADEKEEEPVDDKIEPTHYSQLDPKNMVVNDLRNELKARNVNSKGLKSQLVARLQKALKAEAEKTEDKEKQAKEAESELDISQDVKKNETEEKKMDEKEKALLEKRHTLPETPHIIVHPSKTAKSGKFDCTTMSLSLLLDYRPEDSKEHSFEVSLFAELFNEMLSRDFGFNIFKSLYELPEKKEEKKDKKDKDEDKKDTKKEEGEKIEEKDGENKEKMETDENGEAVEKKEDNNEEKKSDKEKKNGKEDKKKDENGDESEESDKKKKEKERDHKKKEKVKLYTKDRHLLLSFVYFDQTQCGYIFDKDMEDLLYTLGLKMSRAQVKKLISKVIIRDSLHYRKLTDKPKDGESSDSIEDPLQEIDLDEIAQGNKKLLPIFSNTESSRSTSTSTKSVSEAPTTDGFVKFKGAIVDVGKLMSQLERSEKTRLETETRMVDLKMENQKLSDKYHKSSSNIKHLNSELREYKDKLRSSEDVLGKITAHSKLFQQTLIDIKDKIEPVLRSTSYKDEIKKDRDDKDRDKKQDDGKSRWEKDKEHSHTKKDENVELVEVKKEKDD